MAVAKSKTKFTTDLVVAIDSFVTSAIPEFGPFPVAAGTRLRTDHPVVQAVPSFFAEDGTDDAQIAAKRTKLYMESMPPVEATAPLTPPERRLADEDALVNIYDGSRVPKGSSEAKRRPGDYVPVVPAGLNRDDALLVLATMTNIGDGGSATRRVYAGTWLSRSDPLVQVHLHNFAALLPEPWESVPTPKSTRTEA